MVFRTSNTEITPYLGLRSRLSQIWFNRWSLLLFLIFIRVLISTNGLNTDIESARREALSSCTGVESMGSAMASMPHYLSRGVNEMAASGIEAGVRALEKTVLMLVTGIQEIVIFVVHMFTSTYLCLIMLAINSSIGAVTDAAKAIVKTAEDSAKAIFNELDDEKGDFQNAINKVTDKISAVPNFFGADVKIPKLELPAMDKLKDFSVANKVGEDLDKLKDNIPNFKEVQDAADEVIRKPFELIKKEINDSLTVYEFKRDVFPIPAKEQLTFCSDNPAINDFFLGLIKTIDVTKKIVFGVVLALVFVVMFPMGYIEYRSHRSRQERARNIAPLAQGRSDAPFYIDASNIIGRPYPTALGLAGLFGVLAQYVVLKKVESETPKLAAEVGEFAGIVVEKLQDASEKWALTTNQAIIDTNDELNKELFGWVRKGTSSVNDTLTTFVDEMNKSLDLVFGKTPLKEPIKDVINCLIGLKVAGIQKGLTWAHDHAKITFPLLKNDTFSVGASDSILPESDNAESFLADPGSHATDKISNSLARLTDKWKDSLVTEAIINACIVGIWVLCIFIALGRVGIKWFSTGKTRGEGGGAPVVMEPMGHSRGYSQDTVFEDTTRRSFDTYKASSSVASPRPVFGHGAQGRVNANGYTYDEKR